MLNEIITWPNGEIGYGFDWCLSSTKVKGSYQSYLPYSGLRPVYYCMLATQRDIIIHGRINKQSDLFKENKRKIIDIRRVLLEYHNEHLPFRAPARKRIF